MATKVRTPAGLTPDEALLWMQILWVKVCDPEVFQKNCRSDFGQSATEMAHVAKAALAALLATHTPQPEPTAAHDLRNWFARFLSDEGLVRVQNARRQTTMRLRKRVSQPVESSGRQGSSDFMRLAAEAGVTKAVYVQSLQAWLMHDEEGRKVASRFAQTLRAT
jgi:hypothetical protein